MKATSIKKKPPAKKEVKENSFPVVAIGASAGGLEAMMELLKYLPSDTGMAFIYVQHLSPDHKSMLTEILSKKTKMKVQEIDDMDKIQPDNLFVIPYKKGIEVTDGHIKLIPRSETSAAISIDILFSSLAHAQKERVIGIVLSGSASDGAIGIKDIKQEGGLTFAQDDTAKFQSMPHSAIATGMVDFILSPKEIALELGRLSKHPLIKTIGVKNGEEDLIENSNPDLKTILNQLHKATGVDFSAYKMNTIKRRIIRRMLLYKIKALKEYAKLLAQKKEEIDILYQDLLINVTSFFRDTDTHKYLKENLFPKLLKRKKTGESLRIWVPACATGEEAYSIAMMLLEIQGSQTTNIPVQIFATDLSHQAISKGRIGTYTKQDLETVSPKRIQRFFTKADGGFRVNKAVRDMVVFAPHNILNDPPFSRLDFISCCNLFIYFDTAAQKKAVNTFHYALNDDGFLMLGKSENISQSANLFTGFNKKYKIFSRKLNSGNRTLPALSTRFVQQSDSEKNGPAAKRNKTNQNSSVHYDGLDNAIDAVLVSDFMPASVVVNHQMEILQFRGTTDLFLTHPKGKATFNILKMARPEIAFELRNAISKVIKTKHRIRKSGIEIKINSDVRSISVEVVPLKIEWNEPLLLILFTEQEHTEIYSQQAKGGKNNSLAKDRRIKKLEQELAAAHADALAIAQEQEAFTEELQSANEEVVSSNEELQTVNEELETSKEEIESANEELTTTNQELQTRNDLLNESYEYSEAITATIHEAMIVLDKNLRIKSANKSFYKIFKVKEEETEGMFLFDLGNKQWNIPSLREFLQEVVLQNSHFHDFEVAHNFPQIGEKIMLLNASRVIQKRHGEELILLSINDVTEVRKKAIELQVKEKEILLIHIDAEQNLRKKIEASEKQLQTIFSTAPAAIAVLKGPSLKYVLANADYQKMTNRSEAQLLGKTMLEAFPELTGTGAFEIFENVFKTGETFSVAEYPTAMDKNNDGVLQQGYYKFTATPIKDEDGKFNSIMVLAFDVTSQIEDRKKIEESEKRYNMMLMKSPFAFAVFKGKDMVITLANESVKEMWGKGKDLEGKPLFDVIPELKDSAFPGLLDKVYTTGIPFYGDELLAPILRNGKHEEVYFNFVYQPYLEADETISGVTVIAYEVTAQVIVKKALAALREAEKKELKLVEETNKRYYTMLMESPFAFSVMKGKDMVVNLANDLIKEFWGKGNEVEGKTLLQVLPELKEQPFPAMLNKVYTTGIPIYANEILALLKHKDKMEERYFNIVYQPDHEADGTISGVITIAYEVTEMVLARKKNEEAKERFQAAVAAVEGILWTNNAKGEMEGEQLGWSSLTGQNYEAYQGYGWANAIHPDDAQPTIEAWDEAVKNRKDFVFEHRVRLKNGDWGYFSVKAIPLLNEDGLIWEWVGVHTDISKRKQSESILKESEKKFKQLAELMPQKVWTADAKGNKNYFNKTLLDYAGLPFEVLKGGGWKKIIHPDDWEQDENKWKESVSEGKKYQSESRFLRKDGEYLWHLTLAVPLKDEQDNIILWIGCKTEIDEQRKQKKLLEEAVSKRTVELKQANEELLKMNKELEAFTYISSHDLQEPLRKIQTFASRILEKENQNLSDSGKNYFHLMQNAAHRMQALIQDLLAFSRVSVAERKFEITDLNIIIEEIKNEFKEAIAEKHAIITVKEICDVKIIPFQFRQLMHNLIGNALKFSNPDVPPVITITGKNIKYSKLNLANLPPQKEYCHINITDNGIGFEKEFSTKIFEVFQKLHGKEEYAGTGIGLAIVKKIVDNHNGVITATSKLNKGAAFDIYIPAQ